MRTSGSDEPQSTLSDAGVFRRLRRGLQHGEEPKTSKARKEQNKLKF